MHFLHPWLLLGLALVPAAVLLHVFRAPGRRHEVSSLELWRGVLAHVPPESTERLKRVDWLLLVEILVVILLVLALAWPVIPSERPRRHVGFILDLSASMKTAGPDGKTREREAREKVEAIVARLGADDRISVSLCGSQVCLRQATPAEFRRSADLVFAATEAEDPPAKALAGGLAQLSEPEVVFFVTDNLPPDAPKDPAGRVRVITVGGPSRNAGIVAFSGESAADGTLELFVRVVNYADAEVSRRLVVANASKTLASEDLQLPRLGGVAELVLKVRLAADDPVVRVKLEGAGDGFAPDDEVAGTLRPLLVAGMGEPLNPAYRRLFGGPVFEGTIFVDAPDNAICPPDSLVVAEGVIPAARGALTVLVNPPAGEIPGIRIGNPALLAQPASPVGAGGDPLLAGVALSEIRLADFRPLMLSETARPLMRVAGQVVAAESGISGATVIVLGFDPARAGWTLKPSFVVFWANVLSAAKKAGGAGGLVFYHAGEVVRIPLGAEKGAVDGPEGREDILPRSDGWGICRPTRVGVYRWAAGARSGWFAVNLLSEVESDNRPRAAAPVSLDLPAAAAARSVALGPWLLLAAGILAAAWWHLRR